MALAHKELKHVERDLKNEGKSFDLYTSYCSILYQEIDVLQEFSFTAVLKISPISDSNVRDNIK